MLYFRLVYYTFLVLFTSLAVYTIANAQTVTCL